MSVSKEVFEGHANSEDELTMVVRCHQDLDAVATEVVNVSWLSVKWRTGVLR
jgi:hypothetical protein